LTEKESKHINVINMKKKIFAIIAVVAIAAIAGWNISQSKSDNVLLSDVALTNVEALADETSTSAECHGLLGWCSLSCNRCGARLNALGSSYTHNCSSN
jgi:1,4-dihydroxy-2-naphthoyl-CoA synthase